MALCKNIVRFGVIAGLAVGGVALLAGPHTVGNAFSQARHAVSQGIDSMIDDPVALRSQLRDLEARYPDRIATVESELFELSSEIAQLESDRTLATRVIELARVDLDGLQTMLSRAEEARSENASRTILVRFEGNPMPVDQAYDRAREIQTTINAYTSQLEASETSLAAFRQQSERMSELLQDLRSEHAEFVVRINQLDQEIAMIERNDRLIDMVEEREEVITKYSKRDGGVSLDQVTSRMQKLRAEQESKLKTLMTADRERDYADEARDQINRERQAREAFESTLRLGEPAEKEVKIIDEDTPSKSVATNDAVIIDS